MFSSHGKHKLGVENTHIKPIPHFSDLFYFSPLPVLILPQDPRQNNPLSTWVFSSPCAIRVKDGGNKDKPPLQKLHVPYTGLGRP